MSASSKQRSLLANGNRRKLLLQLEKTPGLNLSTLARETGMAKSLARFHVRRLKRADLVAVKDGPKGNERICFLAKDEELWEQPRTRVLFGGKATRNVALYVADNAGSTVQEIAEALDLEPRTIRHHLEILRERELVDSVSVGRRSEIHPEPELVRWQSEVGGSYETPWGADG